jgi:hypothetical protein
MQYIQSVPCNPGGAAIATAVKFTTRMASISFKFIVAMDLLPQRLSIISECFGKYCMQFLDQ